MVEYRAFFTTYDGITDELTTPVIIRPLYTTDTAFRGISFEVEALWDTGATDTCVKPTLWERLKLRPLEFGRKQFTGIGGNVTADLTFVNLLLTPKLEIVCSPVYITDFPGDADMLIGMDIIGLGDFIVCNANNKTSFSFAIPPFPDRINLADKAEIANKLNQTESST